jgi:Ni/Co efflux regulator RcnB
MKKKLTTLACLVALGATSIASYATVADAQTAAERRREREQRRDERRDSLRDTFTGWDRLAERTISATGTNQTLNVASNDRRYDRLRLRSLRARSFSVTSS